MSKDKEFKRWLKERDEAVLSLDINKFKEFYNKWMEKGIYNEPLPSDEVIEVSMRKCVCGLANPPKDKLSEARAWLSERGYSWEF